MKILSKQEIDSRKSLERKKEVEEGLKLAKTVDNLRKVKGEEEANLRVFRDKSLETIKSEIDTKIVERDRLSTEVNELFKKRIEAQAPVDLTQEWKKVESDKKELENLKRELLDRETQISVKEMAFIELSKRQSDLKVKEVELDAYLTQAKLNYDKTEEIRSQIEERKKQSEIDINSRLDEVISKEQDMVSREYLVNQSKEVLKQDKM